MTKRILIFVLILSTLSLCACAPKPSEDTSSTQTTTPTPAQTPDTASPSQSPSPSQETESPPPAPSGPAVRVSAELEDGCTVIAGRDVNALYNMSSPYVYLYADEPVYDLLVSTVNTYSNDEDEEEVFLENSLYVPELSTNQAILMPDPYAYDIEGQDFYYTRIAYTNSAGEYEAVKLFGEADNNNPSVEFAEMRISDKIYSENYYNDEYDLNSFPNDFIEKMLNGDFDDYIPKGFCITDGTLGDVNSDGTQDALICLTSAAISTRMYLGVVPLFVLTGQPNGGYDVECKVAEALFSPYRGESHPVAGDGYIDIVYSYVGGAASHHTQIMRFLYDRSKNDWLLHEFSYQPMFSSDYSEELPPEFVRPLPDFAGLPLEKLTGDEFYDSSPDLDFPDTVVQFIVPSYNEYNEFYTLIVKLNEEAGYYEGYIYHYYEVIESGGFIQTVRGEYDAGTALDVTADEEGRSFTVFGDIWTMGEYDPDSFFLRK